jgi:hypothetical protein
MEKRRQHASPHRARSDHLELDLHVLIDGLLITGTDSPDLRISEPCYRSVGSRDLLFSEDLARPLSVRGRGVPIQMSIVDYCRRYLVNRCLGVSDFLASPPDAGGAAPTTTVKPIIRPKNPLLSWSLLAATFSTT